MPLYQSKAVKQRQKLYKVPKLQKKCKKTLYNFSLVKYNTVIKQNTEAILQTRKEMKIMKKFIALFLAVLMLTACFAGCGKSSDSDLDYIKANKKIVVGITDYAPMDYKDENGQWTGFDAEFARLFADELGVDIEFFVIADWGKKFVELDTKNIDAVWNGMTITDEAKLNASVSDPYVLNAQVVVAKADKIASIATAADLKELKVAVENGSAGQDAAEAAEITNIIKVQDQAAALLEVKSGTSDACVIDITMARAMTGEGTDYADLAAGISLTEEEYGVAFRKDSDLTAKFNAFMDKLQKDGTLENLAKKYNLTLAD